jgi:hypothetical protein
MNQAALHKVDEGGYPSLDEVRTTGGAARAAPTLGIASRFRRDPDVAVE